MTTPVGGGSGTGGTGGTGGSGTISAAGFNIDDCPELAALPFLHRRDVIIIQLLELVKILLSRLEETVVVQTQDSLLSTRIQRKYTTLISKVDLRKVSELDADPTDDTIDIDNDALEELKSDNETIQKRLEDMRNARTLERDKGKEITDAIKATNDNIQQQSQLGSALLQQLGELIRAIFR